MNLSTITQVAASLVNDPDQTKFAGKYTQAINLAQQQFSFDAKCCFTEVSYTVVSATAAYSLPTDFWLEKKVTLNGIRLAPTSRETLEFDSGELAWNTLNGTPTQYLIDPEESEKNIVLVPIPGDGDAGHSLVLTYYFIPTDLSAGTDVPFNSYSLLGPYHVAIAYWAAWLLLGYDTPTQESEAKKNDLLRKYNDKVTEAVDNFGNTASEPLRMRGGRYF